ncbi:conserved hypothetical protein [Vibrio phage 424E50-1]|nr:conserved hypothetical protein [Vibrio phage 424E50-1]
MKQYKYFSYCPETGFETYVTAKEAETSANEAIDYFRDHADEGWDESVNQVCWGEIKQETVITDEKSIKEAEEDLGLTFNHPEVIGYVDYGLVDFKESSDEK